MSLYQHILVQETNLEKSKTTIESRLQDAPPGRLIFQRNGAAFKYYQRVPVLNQPGKTTKKYLNKKNLDLIRRLAQKALDQKELQICQNELKAIHAYLKEYDENANQRYLKLLDSEAIRNLNIPASNSPFVDCAKWEMEEYDKSIYHPENLIVPGVKGTMYRSKSEAFIAYTLFTHAIPFRYECGLPLQHVKVYPDFTILHPITNEILIWEHFGMMDNADYIEIAGSKIKAYIENGYIPNHNLFMTFESSKEPFDFQEAVRITETIASCCSL